MRIWRAPHREFIQKILIIVLFALVLIVLWQGAEVVLLIFAGFLLAVFLRSLSGVLSKRAALSENLALIAVLISIIGVIALGAWLLLPSMQNQFDDLSDQLPAAFERARQNISQYSLGREIIKQIPSARELVANQSPSILGRVTGIFSTVFDVVVNVLIVLMTAVYFAFNPKLYKEGIFKLVPKSREKRAREIIGTIEFTLRRFLLGIFISVTINGTITFLGLWFLGIPFAIPLAVIIAVFNFIPNIGPIAASIPAILIAFSISPTKALYVALLYLAVQNIDGFVTTPLVQQRAVSIPPVLIIAAQLLLAVLFGFLGLLLAVPIVAVVFVAVKMIYVEDVLDRRVEVKGEEQTIENQSEQNI
ncbi:MAG: AI-2E family transporter [Pyrinomonadaceae bacterium]